MYVYVYIYKSIFLEASSSEMDCPHTTSIWLPTTWITDCITRKESAIGWQRFSTSTHDSQLGSTVGRCPPLDTAMPRALSIATNPVESRQGSEPSLRDEAILDDEIMNDVGRDESMALQSLWAVELDGDLKHCGWGSKPVGSLLLYDCREEASKSRGSSCNISSEFQKHPQLIHSANPLSASE